MDDYIAVVECEEDDAIELPLEHDGSLLLATLKAQFPGACGLKYRNSATGNFRGVRLVDGRLSSTEGGWEGDVHIVVYPKENKRKQVAESDDAVMMFPKKREFKKNCSDLIVLGLPWKADEDDLKTYFSQFGELLMTQIKKDLKTGQSKGFGFIRFNDYEAQLKVIQQRHMLGGRMCDVRIPNSKGEAAQQLNVNRKVFVGRLSEDITPEDLRTYFSHIGEVVDVFIPKPFRAFAFVTFEDPDVAQSLCGEDHVIKNASCHISSASPKNPQDKSNMTGRWGPQGQYGPNAPPGGNTNNFGQQQQQQQQQQPSHGYNQGQQGGYNSQGGFGQQQNGGGFNGQGGWQGQQGPPMNNPLNMFLNPAMMAAAQAALGQAAQAWQMQGGNQGMVPQQQGGHKEQAMQQNGAQGGAEHNTRQGSWDYGQQQGAMQTQQGGWRTG